MWNCLQTVDARVARHSFGIGYHIPFNFGDASHQGRRLTRGLEGLPWVGPVWDHILSKVWRLVHYGSMPTTGLPYL